VLGAAGARVLGQEELFVELGIVRGGNSSAERVGDFVRDSVERGRVRDLLVRDAVDVARLLRDRDAGVEKPVVTRDDLARATDDDADLDDTIVRGVTAGRLTSSNRDPDVAPRRVLRELGEAADDRAEQVRDAG
jgi:hypothetical protein